MHGLCLQITQWNVFFFSSTNLPIFTLFELTECVATFQNVTTHLGIKILKIENASIINFWQLAWDSTPSPRIPLPRMLFPRKYNNSPTSFYAPSFNAPPGEKNWSVERGSVSWNLERKRRERTTEERPCDLQDPSA